jgi:CubicO group peptidase (beta-lactamase class C family)
MKITTPSKVGLARKRLKRITDKMQQHIDQGNVAGTITLVARRGQVAHYEIQGLRDVAAGRPMSEDTLFRIYSMTKPITSLAVLMLYEAGHFHLTDPVANFIPAFADLKVYAGPDFTGFRVEALQRAVTIRDLLTHTAGLSYGWFDDVPVEALYRERTLMDSELSLAEAVQRLCEMPLLYQPGTAWRYSVATDVLGYLVEVVSGQPFAQFLSEHIFAPLGMSETAFFVPEEKMARFAALYEPAEGGGIQLMSPDMSNRFVKPPRNVSGGGGLVSTMGDYLRFGQMLLNQGSLDGTRLVSRKTIELMTANHLALALMPIKIGPNPSPGYGFGLGVRVLVDPAQAQWLGSAGEYGWGGLASTYFFIDPREAMLGILMTQLVPREAHPIRNDFRTMAYQAIVD